MILLPRCCMCFGFRVWKWGPEVVKDTKNRATTKCTEFLLATATGKHATPCEKTKLSAYTLGAVTSCIRLYAYIGKELQGLIDGKSNHRYKKWIENYSSDNFQLEMVEFGQEEIILKN